MNFVDNSESGTLEFRADTGLVVAGKAGVVAVVATAFVLFFHFRGMLNNIVAIIALLGWAVFTVIALWQEETVINIPGKFINRRRGVVFLLTVSKTEIRRDGHIAVTTDIVKHVTGIEMARDYHLWLVPEKGAASIKLYRGLELEPIEKTARIISESLQIPIVSAEA